MKHITLSDVERINVILGGETEVPQPPKKPSQKKTKKKPSKATPKPKEEAVPKPKEEAVPKPKEEAVPKPKEEAVPKENTEFALSQAEAELEARIEQFKKKVSTMLDESEAMIQSGMNDMQRAKVLFDAISNQLGESASVVMKSYSGAGIAYQPWDYEKHEWGEMCSTRSVAEQLGNGVVKEVWVWYEKGVIKKILNREELEKYCP